MYMMEWHAYAGQRKVPEEFEKIRKDFNKQREKHAKGQASELDNYGHPSKKACDDPDGGRSVYEMNDTYIEVRTPFDEKRGMVTAGALSFLAAPVGVGLPTVFQDLGPMLLSGRYISSGTPLSSSDFVFVVLSILLIVGLIAGGFYFGWKYWRLEAFVQRRLLVRFNRKTRKVYVHRPGYAGGVYELNWEDCLASECARDEHKAHRQRGVEMPLILTCPFECSPHGQMEMLFVGRWPRHVRESLQLWEFIRRYMEEGPGSVPRPRRLGRFPWPWKSVSAALSLIWPLLSFGSLRWTVPLLVLISPAIAIFATAQWLALLTCWEPVWPKAIRQACEDGAWPWVRDRLIDLGAWAMLAALVWAVLRGVYGVG